MLVMWLLPLSNLGFLHLSIVDTVVWLWGLSRALKAGSLPIRGQEWRRKWQPTPVFSPGEPQGQRSLVGCRLWGGRTESDTTEAT